MGKKTQAFEAALNGVLGDYLAERHTSLAIELGLYDHGRPLPLTAEDLARAHPRAGASVCVLVHGSSYDESSWSYPEAPETSYGTLLERELGLTPFYVRYNSGLHISENGRALAALLQRLLEVYRPPITELTLIGHSMGGLVIRSACHYGVELGHDWVSRTRRAIYLGSPHLGSPHEKAGHVATQVLEAIPDPVVQLAGSLAKLRSAGVKDLRHGSLVDEDWVGRDPDAPGERPRSLPLHPGIEHYLVAGTLAKDPAHLVNALLGDALVRVPSALGPGEEAGLDPDHFAVFAGMNHVRLVHDPAVYDRIRAWCGASGASPVTQPTSGGPGPTAAPIRHEAYRALVEDAVDKGATAVQQVQEALTARPYDLLAEVPTLEAPVKAVRAIHFGVLRGTYASVRAINKLTGVALANVLEALKKKPE